LHTGIENPVNDRQHLVLHVREDVGINISCDCGSAVPEPLHHHPQGNALHEENSSMGMAEALEIHANLLGK